MYFFILAIIFRSSGLQIQILHHPSMQQWEFHHLHKPIMCVVTHSEQPTRHGHLNEVEAKLFTKKINGIILRDMTCYISESAVE
jgi:hypothetical protein